MLGSRVALCVYWLPSPLLFDVLYFLSLLGGKLTYKTSKNRGGGLRKLEQGIELVCVRLMFRAQRRQKDGDIIELSIFL